MHVCAPPNISVPRSEEGSLSDTIALLVTLHARQIFLSILGKNPHFCAKH